MHYLKVTYNNGILMETFNTLRVHDNYTYAVGNTVIVQYGKRQQEIGEAIIVCKATVAFEKLTPMMTAMLTGKDNPNYLRAIVQKMYPGSGAGTLLDWMVLRWTQRYLQEQEDMARQWWDKIVATTPNYQDFKNGTKSFIPRG